MTNLTEKEALAHPENAGVRTHPVRHSVTARARSPLLVPGFTLPGSHQLAYSCFPAVSGQRALFTVLERRGKGMFVLCSNKLIF